MPAIITQNFRFSQLETFRNQLTSTPYMYLGIGKPFPWSAEDGAGASDDNPPTPSQDSGKDFPDLMSVKKIEKEKTVYVIPRYNWRKGDLYDYVGKQNGTKNYVLTSEFKLYKVIDVPYVGGVQQPAINEPNLTSTSMFSTADGYKWKYMLTLTTADVIEFLTNEWIPIRKMTASNDVGGIDQWIVQQAAVAGTIDKYVINSGGSGYTTTPTLTVSGNGTGASISPIMSGNSIVGITINSLGSGYTYSKVTVTGNGSGASISPILSPLTGHGSSAVTELSATNLMINMLLSFDEGSGDFPKKNDYRKIFLLNDLTEVDTNAVATAITYSAMEVVNLQSASYTPQALTINSDDTILGTTSGATAEIVEFDDVGNNVYIVFRENNFISSRINSYSIQTAGSGYTVGQLLSFNSGTGVEAKAYITSINGTGGVTGLNFDTGASASRGRNYVINDIITGAGGIPSVACQIKVISVETENVKVYRNGIDTGILGSNITFLQGEINKNGNIIYKDYRNPIIRDINQRENIIVVLGF